MLGLGLGLGRNLLLGGGSDGNLVPGIDFTTWYNVPLSPMASTTTNTFTNSGTGYIQLDIGAVAGEVYTITINQTRGAGTCLIYLAANQGVTQADEVWGLEGGEETITLVADGPWLTFRASVGNTTTVVSELVVKKGVVTDPLQELIQQLFGNGEQGAFYLPKPVVNGQQVLFQDAAGTIPVTADGDPVGLMLDISGRDSHAAQTSSSSRPTYRTDGTLRWLEFDGVDDFMDLPTSLVSGVQGFYATSAMAWKGVFAGTGDKSLVWFSTPSSDTSTRWRVNANGDALQVAGRRLDGEGFSAGAIGGTLIYGEVSVVTGFASYSDGSALVRVGGDVAASAEEAFSVGTTSTASSMNAFLCRQGNGNYTSASLYGLILCGGVRSDFSAEEDFMFSLAGDAS